MEYKRIEDLSITECLERVQIPKATAKAIVTNSSTLTNIIQRLSNESAVENSEIRELVINRLTDLLLKDKSAYFACKNTSDFKAYLKAWADGLWLNEAGTCIKQIEETEKESKYYECNKNSISGLKKYLSSYPGGKFSDSARQLLKTKKRNWKIKTISASTIALLVVAILCYSNYHSVSYLDAIDDMNFGKKGGNVSRTISTDALGSNIRLSTSIDWIEINKNGKDFTIEVNPNHGAEKNGIITVYAYTTLFNFNLERKETSFNVRQISGVATNLNVTESSLHFEKYSSDTHTIYATTDGTNLNITTEGIDDDWISVSHNITEDGDNYKAKIVVCSYKNEGGEKHGTIVVRSDSYERRISLSQESGLATYFNVLPDNLDISEEGNGEGRHYPVKVETDGTTWSVKDKPDWDGLNTDVRLSSGILSVTVGSNPGRIRTGTITLVSNNGDLRDIAIKQWGDPTNLSASCSSIKFGTSRDDENVSISNDSKKSLSTTISSGDSRWLSASVRNKSNIRISCTTNSNYPRSGTVYVECGGERTSIIVKQDGWESCSSCGGSGHVRCTSCNNGYTACTNYNYTGVVDSRGQYGHGKWETQYTYINGMPFPQNRLDICPTCGGSYRVKCSYCGGDGQRDCSRCDGCGKTKKSY